MAQYGGRMAYVVFVGGVVVVLAGLTWFASWAKRRGHGSGVAGALAAYAELGSTAGTPRSGRA
jgi:hypothetical protein